MESKQEESRKKYSKQAIEVYLSSLHAMKYEYNFSEHSLRVLFHLEQIIYQLLETKGD